jgi:nucleoside-diphosphate-sugar epimerase
MRVVVTGSSGRVGRAIVGTLAMAHQVVGIDRTSSPTTTIVGDILNSRLLQETFIHADAVIHAAALHAPHVGLLPDEEFLRVNVEGTRHVAEAALATGVSRLVFTSTTALYGNAPTAGRCRWVQEDTPPEPRTVYHRTKLEAEHELERAACNALAVRVLRMSRCFPEPCEIMASYRLHRGVDLRDVAAAHVAALTDAGQSFQRYIVSARTPFLVEDCESLACDAVAVLKVRSPLLVQQFNQRGWVLPRSIDRVYDSTRAMRQLGWEPRFGFDEVLAQFDRRSPEVLPPMLHATGLA